MSDEGIRDFSAVLPALERREQRIRERLQAAEASLPRTGVALIDYAIDQVRFFLEAWRDLKAAGHSDLSGLEYAGLLSLPECLRKAKLKWKKDLLLKYAGSGQWACWQRALDARSATDEVSVVPRQPGWPGSIIQLSPYPSATRLPPGAMVTLEAAICHNPGGQPSPVHPLRTLQQTPAWWDQFLQRTLAWSLQLVFYHKRRRRPLRVLIDPAWDFDREAAQAALREIAKRTEALAEAASRGPNPFRVEITECWRMNAKALLGAANRLVSGSPSEWAAVLQRCFVLPGATYLIPVAFLTQDLPPHLMDILLGFQVKARGLLSVRESRRFDQYVGRRLQEEYELTPPAAKWLAAKLAHFQRPLREESVTRYVNKVLKRFEFPQHPRQRVGRALQLLATQLGLPIWTVRRQFRMFLEKRRLRRDRRAVRLFGRSLRRRSKTGGADRANGRSRG